MLAAEASFLTLVEFLPGLALVLLVVVWLALVLDAPVPAVSFCSRRRTTVGVASTVEAAGVLAGAVVLVAGVVVVACVVAVEFVEDDSPVLASGLGSTEVDVVVGVVEESAVLTGWFAASTVATGGPPKPAAVNPPPASAHSTVRSIRR